MIPDDWEAKWCWQTENCGQKVNSQRQHCDVGCQEAEVEQKLHLQLQCVNGQRSANHKLLSLVNKVNPPIKAGTNQFSELTSPISTCQTWLSGWEKKPLINQLRSTGLSRKGAQENPSTTCFLKQSTSYCWLRWPWWWTSPLFCARTGRPVSIYPTAKADCFLAASKTFKTFGQVTLFLANLKHLCAI